MFKVELIAENTYMFNDQEDDSFYLLLEDDGAILIDTGISRGIRLLDVIREYTDKPITLFVTHGHYDHCYHMGEFDRVYMSRLEDQMLEIDRYLVTADNPDVDLNRAIDIKNGDSITIGGETITAIEVGGHTPGSLVFYANKRNLLFTGDAIGSGCGVWLQLPGVLSLDEYLKGLDDLLAFLSDKDPVFYGGHQSQIHMSKVVPGTNSLDKDYVKDMYDLVLKVLNGEIIGSEDEPYGYGPAKDRLYATYKRAELLYLSYGINRED